MASPENFSLEAWGVFLPNLAGISEACARDTEILTKALQNSISTNANSISIAQTPFLKTSDPEPASTKQHRNAIPATGKVSKRKSRAAKRSQTTFITADPANFRQMVQQVTGVRFGDSQAPFVSVLKPEPQRASSRLEAGSAGCLPTLDTSAFLLDHHLEEQVISGSTSTPVTGSESGSGSGSGDSALFFPEPVTAEGGGLDFESLLNFPTLDSWKVM